jgi:hypothetical protein
MNSRVIEKANSKKNEKLTIIYFFPEISGSCYFPAAFQGEYVTQAIMSGVPTISYSSLSIQFDSIPVWGVCHRRYHLRNI